MGFSKPRLFLKLNSICSFTSVFGVVLTDVHYCSVGICFVAGDDIGQKNAAHFMGAALALSERKLDFHTLNSFKDKLSGGRYSAVPL